MILFFGGQYHFDAVNNDARSCESQIFDPLAGKMSIDKRSKPSNKPH